MSASNRLSMVDAGFLIMENRRMPQHVSSLTVLTLPAGADETEFLHYMADCLKQDEDLDSPFGHVLKTGRLGVFGPIHWAKDKSLDMDYHVRHSALPKPGRYRELFALVSRLQGTLLDRTRPLWESHLIEGLQNRQFALYTKMHHAAVDGVRGAHLTRQMYSPDPAERTTYSPFSKKAAEAYKKLLPTPAEKKRPSRQNISAVSEFMSEQFGHAVNVSGALRRFAEVWAGRNTRMSVPWHKIPKTPLNTKIDGARRFVAQSWPVARIKAVGKAFDGTLNDAVLGMVSGALRRYLTEHSELPEESLKSMAPISLRAANDPDSSNAVAFICADLATNIDDPVKRMQAICDSMKAGKEQFEGLSALEAELYFGITNTPMVLTGLLGLAGQFPAFSTAVSNIPGPRELLYWNGARIDGHYPMSIVIDGIALNFTMQSMFDRLDFGIIACRRSVPQVQRMIDYLEDALVELEEAAGITATVKKSRAAARSKAPAKRRTKAKPKAQRAAKSAANE